MGEPVLAEVAFCIAHKCHVQQLLQLHASAPVSAPRCFSLLLTAASVLLPLSQWHTSLMLLPADYDKLVLKVELT